MADDLRWDAYRLHVAGHLSIEEYEVVLERIAENPTAATVPRPEPEPAVSEPVVSEPAPVRQQWLPVFAIVGSTLAVGVAAAILVVTS